jgi:hypothetical protein
VSSNPVDLIKSSVTETRAAMAEAATELIRQRSRIDQLERQLLRSTELYAKIKRSSEYHHQHDGKVPFAVTFSDSLGLHVVLGNSNRYRISDLRFYVKVGDKFVAIS